MRIPFVLALLLAACSVETDVVDDGEKVFPPEPRALSCPGTSADDVCLLFNDTSAAAVSFTPTTEPTIQGAFLTGEYSIPMTGVSNGATYTFYFCPTTSPNVQLAESTISIPVDASAAGTASLHFTFKNSDAGRNTVTAQAFSRATFPDVTTAPALPSANGDWLRAQSDPAPAVGTAPTPMYIVEHDSLFLFLFKDQDVCSGWYGVEHAPRQFRIPTGAEYMPDAYTNMYGSFSEDYLTALLVVEQSGCVGACNSEEKYTLYRP